MKSKKRKLRLSRASVSTGLIIVGVFSGCGKVDDQFSAETYDEYSEPLTNAIIGTPDGTVVVTGPDGRVVSSASGSGNATNPSTPGPVAGPAPSGTGGSFNGAGGGAGSFGSDGGSAGAAGNAGAAGSAGAAGTAGAAGSVGVGGSFGVGGDGLGGVAGSGGDDGTGEESGFGSWHFDDCSPSSHFLTDSSGFGANAQHDLGATCVPGISGQGVLIRSQKDLIQVPDEPQFQVQSRVAVAAWVNPTKVSGDQPIVIKRLNNQTSFSLGIHNGNIEMAVVLDDGTTVISRAPIAAGKFTHVAGMFDGTFVFLFINGQQFGQIYAAGTLRNVFAPIRIGATTQSQHFDGIIDEVFVSTENLSKDQLVALSCIQRPTTFSVTPDPSGPVEPGTAVAYDIAVNDNDVGACGDTQYEAFTFNGEFGINVFFDTNFQPAQPGTTVHFNATVNSTEDADVGVHQIPFQLDAFDNTSSEFFSGQLVYELTPPTGCFVSQRRELMITNLSVVDDPVRTAGNGAFGGGGGFPPPPPPPVFDGGIVPLAVAQTPAPAPAPAADAGVGSVAGGVWSFGHLMRELAPSAASAPAMVERVLQTFTTTQVVNGFSIGPRPGMQSTILDAWARTPDGALDLDQAPVTLEAIVNRIDVRDLSVGSAGEGRFVFGVNGLGGFPLQFTMIFEYNLPGKTEADVLEWANLWHGLQAHPFPSEEYNAALEAITRRFSSRDASPGSVNGSALLSFRTNEIDLGDNGLWQLRQFDLSPDTGFFRQVPLSETPDLGFNGTSTFADLVNQNASAIISLVPGGTGNTVPPVFEGQNFEAGAIFNDGGTEWFAPGINDPEARFHASLNTCNGCHGPETNSSFLQITPRFPGGGGEAALSPFITGTTVFDRFTGQPRTLNDLGRRKEDLTRLVCGDSGPALPVPPPPAPNPGPPVRIAIP